MTFSKLLIIVFLLCACQNTPLSPKPRTTSFYGNAMTIDYSIIIGESLAESDISRAHEIIQSVFQEIDSVYNKWNPDSELSRLNNLPAKTPVPLSSKLQEFLQRVDEIVKLTDGRFDPTIEPLQALWKESLTDGNEPELNAIESILPAVGWDKIHVESGLFYKDHGAVKLDLGGVAKGFCVDLLIERLSQSGYQNVFVEWGGEIRAAGKHPEGRPWMIFICRLENSDPACAIAHVPLLDQAIATSGDYLQNWKIETPQSSEPRVYAHIINPATHSPIVATSTSVASVSVLAPSCALADAIATALMLFPRREEAEIYAKKLQAIIPGLSFWIVSRDML